MSFAAIGHRVITNVSFLSDKPTFINLIFFIYVFLSFSSLC